MFSLTVTACIHSSSSIVLPPCEPLLPPVTHSDLGLHPMNEGWSLGGSALLLPGVDQLWSWLGASGSCQELQREMDEPLCWLLGIGLWCVSGDWWVNTAPPAPQVRLMHPYHETNILSWGSYMLTRKGKEIRSRRLVNWAVVGWWLRGRADSIVESSARAAQTTGRHHSSAVIKTEGLLMHWWGFKCLWRALTVWLFICFARPQSVFSALGPTRQQIELLKAVHLWTLDWSISIWLK